MKTVKGSLVGIALLLMLLFCVACGESDPTKESYKEAVKLYKAGNYYDAANLFDSIDYKDSQEKADECYFLVQKDGLKHVSVGDIVKFGYYEQDDYKENGQEEIEWLVLGADETGEKLLLISRFSLDYQKYNSFYAEKISWEECTLRTWLNDIFYNNSFGAVHQKMLVELQEFDKDYYEECEGDKVSILCEKQCLIYFGDLFGYSDDWRTIKGAGCYPTTYAVNRGADAYDGWWLRNLVSDDSSRYVDQYDRSYNGSDIDSYEYVRPIIVINVGSV